MILWLRFGVIVLGTVLSGMLLFLGAATFTKSKIFAASEWTTGLILGVMFIAACFGTAIGGIDHAIVVRNMAADTATATIPSYVTIRTPDGEEISIYLSWDVLGQDPVESVDWGEIEVGSSADSTYWIRNEATTDVWLTFNTSDWLPVNANETLILTWDRVNLNNWRIVSGNWAIVGEALQISATSRENILARTDPGFNYEISTKTTILSSPNGRPESQVIARYRDNDNYYFAGLGAYGYKAAIGVYEGGTPRMIASGGNPDYSDIVLGQEYDLKVRVAGSTFTVFVDGEEVCSVDDTTHGFGDVGLTTITSDVIYDDFVLVDAFNLDTVLFEEYFAGPPLPVSESEKVTMNLYVDEATTGIDNFSFDIVITAWDEAPP